jgi:DNA-binding transcriptional LysR family regulator
VSEHVRLLEKELDQFLGQVTGTLLEGASTIPGEYVLPAVIGRFRERHPRVAVTLQISDTRGIARAVLDGRGAPGVPRGRVPELRRGPRRRGPLVLG